VTWILLILSLQHLFFKTKKSFISTQLHLIASSPTMPNSSKLCVTVAVLSLGVFLPYFLHKGCLLQLTVLLSLLKLLLVSFQSN